MLVDAVIVTYEAPRSLQATLLAVTSSQDRRLRRIVVVDNGDLASCESWEPIDDDRIVVLRSGENTGPAGGFHDGLEFASRDGVAGAFWLLDDDVRPAPDCLTRLIESVEERECVAAPAMLSNGRRHDTWGWQGVLVPASAVTRAGLPIRELFWAEEDAEWLLYRLSGRHGYELVRVEEAWVTGAVRPAGAAKPAWKYYYEARNPVVTVLRLRPSLPLGQRMKILAVREWRLVRAAVRERRLAAILAIARGLADGVLGRLGRRVTPSSPDRVAP